MVVVHCSASDSPMDDSPERIKLLHTGNKKTPIIWGKYHTHCFGWSNTGYHYIITKDGQVHIGRPIEKAGAHCKGFNKGSIGICLTGDGDFTEAQFKAFRTLIRELLSKHNLSIMDIVGHYELNKKKTCPNFNVHEKYLETKEESTL